MMSGFKSSTRPLAETVKIVNLTRTLTLFLLALGFFAMNRSAPSSVRPTGASLPISVHTIQIPAAMGQQLAENPLTNFEWNTSLTKPAFRRIRFNERYGGCC